MSGYGSLLEQIREAEAAASQLEAALSKEPDDRALRLDFLSARRMADKLKGEFLACASEEAIDVCSYRIVPSYSKDYSVVGVTNTLRSFQDMFTLIYAALSVGPRRRARVSAELADQPTLSIAYTYAGSLGVVLAASGGQTLFRDAFDSTVDAVTDIAEMRNPNDVRIVAERFGKATVTKAYEWSMVNYEKSYPVDLKWRNARGIERGKFIDRADFVRVLDSIGLTSDVEKNIVSVAGIFVGGDIMTRRFHFVDKDDQDYRGLLSDRFTADGLELGRRYIARILVESTVRYATGDEERRYTLMALEADQSLVARERGQ